MFHLETLARVIHADRVRDLERAAEAHRLLATASDDLEPLRHAPRQGARPIVIVASPSDEPAPRVGGSPGLAA